jgi:hypothetical protein
MRAMSTMPVVHEQMHKRACEQKQEWQRAKQVGTVFGKQIKSGNRQKYHKNPVVTAWGTVCIVPGMFVMFHHALLKEALIY